MVTYWGVGCSSWGGGTPALHGDGAGQGLMLLLCPPEQAGPARQRHRQRLRQHAGGRGPDRVSAAGAGDRVRDVGTRGWH